MSEPLYRLLEAWESCPDGYMTKADALDIVAAFSDSTELKLEQNGLLHIEGTAFYLQPMTDNLS